MTYADIFLDFIFKFWGGLLIAFLLPIIVARMFKGK